MCKLPVSIRHHNRPLSDRVAFPELEGNQKSVGCSQNFMVDEMGTRNSVLYRQFISRAFTESFLHNLQSTLLPFVTPI